MKAPLNLRAGIQVTTLVAALAGCSAGYITQRSSPTGFLRLEVTPEAAEVEVDEVYSGVATGWMGGVVPVTPGLRRITLRAPGYIAQRFDIQIDAYEEVTLILALEPILEVPDEDEPEAEAPLRPSLRAMR